MTDFGVIVMIATPFILISLPWLIPWLREYLRGDFDQHD